MSDKSDLGSDGSFSQIEAEAEGLDDDADSSCFEDVVAASVIVELPPSHDEVASGENVASLFHDCIEDMKDEASSCWSEISTFGKAATDDQNSVSSSSYYHVPSDMSIGSLGSTFEKISLSSGIVVHKCDRCSFHNSMEDKVCAMCNIALVANPYPDQDLQISLNLQNKEKQNDERFVRLREARRSGLFTAATLEQASFLVEDIQSYLCAYPDVRRLPWVDMRSQAMSFIAKSLRSKTRHWYIGCVFTQADDMTFNLIASQGFKPSSNTNFKSQLAVAGSITDAWKDFTNWPPDNRPGRQLFSIQEQVVEDPATFSVHELNGTGWLVAVPEIELQEEGRNVSQAMPSLSPPRHSPLFRGRYQRVMASEILPLVAFSREHVGRFDLSMMQNGLKTILEDFFEAAMGAESDRLAAAKPRVTQLTAIVQDLRLSGGENKKTYVEHSDEKRLQVELPDGPRKNAPTNSLSMDARSYGRTATISRDLFGTPSHNTRQNDMTPRPPARRVSIVVDSGSDSKFLSDDMDEMSVTLANVMMNDETATPPSDETIKVPPPSKKKKKVITAVKPLSPYNFFFCEVRDWILRMGDKERAEMSQYLAEQKQKGDAAEMTDISPYLDQKILLSLHGEEHKNRMLVNHWHKDRTKRRKHHKNHGKISFGTLNQACSTLWRTLPKHGKDFYTAVSEADRARYKAEVGDDS